MLAFVLSKGFHFLLIFLRNINVIIWWRYAMCADGLEIEYGRDMVDRWVFSVGNICNTGPDCRPVDHLTHVGMIVNIIISFVSNDYIGVGAPDEVNILFPG